MAHGMDIDGVEYAVLKTFHTLNRPLWKQRVYEYIQDHQDRFPVTDSVSRKTVGRKIDRLKYEQYLEQTIASPDDTARDQIIAYTLTEDGAHAMAAHRLTLLRQVMMNHLFPQHVENDLPKQAIIALMQDQYGFDDDVKEQLFDHDRENVIAFLLIRYMQQEAVNILDRGNLEEYHALLDNHPTIKDGLGIR